MAEMCEEEDGKGVFPAIDSSWVGVGSQPQRHKKTKKKVQSIRALYVERKKKGA
ncbi:hypothetical protein Scep_024978 [Stephania cephalantha]|uniref:Uncharacterized protein n=1 Tax=Stephania cephalantha TaxID=152367 RepID=A0AAP0HU57_9MAGN